MRLRSETFLYYQTWSFLLISTLSHNKVGFLNSNLAIYEISSAGWIIIGTKIPCNLTFTDLNVSSAKELFESRFFFNSVGKKNFLVHEASAKIVIIKLNLTVFDYSCTLISSKTLSKPFNTYILPNFGTHRFWVMYQPKKRQPKFRDVCILGEAITEANVFKISCLLKLNKVTRSWRLLDSFSNTNGALFFVGHIYEPEETFLYQFHPKKRHSSDLLTSLVTFSGSLEYINTLYFGTIVFLNGSQIVNFNLSNLDLATVKDQPDTCIPVKVGHTLVVESWPCSKLKFSAFPNISSPTYRTSILSSIKVKKVTSYYLPKPINKVILIYSDQQDHVYRCLMEDYAFKACKIIGKYRNEVKWYINQSKDLLIGFSLTGLEQKIYYNLYSCSILTTCDTCYKYGEFLRSTVIRSCFYDFKTRDCKADYSLRKPSNFSPCLTSTQSLLLRYEEESMFNNSPNQVFKDKTPQLKMKRIDFLVAKPSRNDPATKAPFTDKAKLGYGNLMEARRPKLKKTTSTTSKFAEFPNSTEIVFDNFTTVAFPTPRIKIVLLPPGLRKEGFIYKAGFYFTILYVLGILFGVFYLLMPVIKNEKPTVRARRKY